MDNFNLKIGQVFEVDGTYIPAKISAYLKMNGVPTSNKYFQVKSYDTEFAYWGCSIDALNIHKYQQGINKIRVNNNIADYTGNGFFEVLSSNVGEGYPRISYPISVKNEYYHVWIRASSSIGEFSANILYNEEILGQINEIGIIDNSWYWYYTTIYFDSESDLILDIELLTANTAIDKIYIAPSSHYTIPVNEGLLLADSPYITVCCQIYKIDNNYIPYELLPIFDSVSSSNNMLADDWYNFNIYYMDSNLEFEWNGLYAFVLMTAGSNVNKYVVWDIYQNNEYICLPSLSILNSLT